MVQRTDKYSKKVLLQKSLPYTFVIINIEIILNLKIILQHMVLKFSTPKCFKICQFSQTGFYNLASYERTE